MNSFDVFVIKGFTVIDNNQMKKKFGDCDGPNLCKVKK